VLSSSSFLKFKRSTTTTPKPIASYLVDNAIIGFDERLHYPSHLGLVGKAVDDVSSLGVGGIVTGDPASFIREARDRYY
jgi:hypothetical protein